MANETQLAPPEEGVPRTSERPDHEIGLPDPVRYRYDGLLAVGGMGEVHRVWDRRLERPLALKRLRPSLATRLDLRARFRNESRITAGLDHPGVVVVFDAGDADWPWYTMRLVPGQRTLGTALKAGGTDTALAAVARVADAMAFAHARGVIHRDLKPDNILVGEQDEVLVIDWGLARRTGLDPEVVAGTTSGTDTRDGWVLGTPTFLAPEQASGEPGRHGPWSDVWSIGVILLEVLTGTRSRAPGESGWGEGVPEPLRLLLDRCLEPVPERRAQDASEVAGPLRRWLDDAAARRRATRLIADARALLPERAARAREAERLAAEAAARVAAAGPRGDIEEKTRAWHMEDAAATARVAQALLDARIEQSCRAALQLWEDMPDAHRQLAELYAERARAAEAERDAPALAVAERLLRIHDDGTWAGWLRGTGAVTLVTEIPAEVRLFRLEARPRRVIPVLHAVTGTPLRALELPTGSWLAEIQAPGRALVRYPFVVARQGHWDGVRPGEREPSPVQLPPVDALGPDDVYVPAGFTLVGGDGRAPNSLPARRVWVEGYVIRRCPVTNREWLAYLDGLVASGKADAALTAEPRETGARTSPYASSPAGYRLVADDQGDAWDPDWPVVLVDWLEARRYAAWEADRTGLPWRLPWELEREKAARGADGRSFPWGEQPEPTWFHNAPAQKGHATPSPAARYPVDRSVYGMMDGAGNVRDWCLDARDAPVPAEGAWATPPTPPIDPADTTWRVCRGGFWSGGLDYGRCAARAGAPATFRHSGSGLRLARSWPVTD